MDPAHPIDSSTVIVLREAGATSEVLLVQRHTESRAFGGAHVFPGGIVDAADAAPTMASASPRFSAEAAAHRLGESSTGPAALAFWIAAIRELFEETGILLATIDGTGVDLADPDVRRRFHDHRVALLGGTSTFTELIAAERLELTTGALEYWSRWITPVTAPRRYDARFFLARMPTGQAPLHDDRETIATAWLTPRAALAEAEAGRMTLAPPTIRTLEDLDALGSVDAIFAGAAGRRVAPILPKTVVVAGSMAVLYPGDADYDDAMPGARLDPTSSGRQNRAVMGDGGWRTIRSGE